MEMVKKKCLRNKYIKTFLEFCDDIKTTLSKTGTEFRNEVASMLAPNFQVLG